ncbi:MAG: hypothetical protein K2Q12_07560, partial [Rickettsiales bacterium]|nr:hypothetical protein [Rickettsiales bacterium]
MTTPHYTMLEARFADQALLGSISSLLGWDAATCMPDGSAELRGQQLAYLAGLSHANICKPEVAEALLEAEAELSDLN